MKAGRAIQKKKKACMENNTSILFGLPSVTPLTACRAARRPVLLLQTR